MKKWTIGLLSLVGTVLATATATSLVEKTKYAYAEEPQFAFSKTVYKVSDDEENLLLVTAIQNYDCVYEIGYTFNLENVETQIAETTKYYDTLTTNKTETAADIFGAEYTNAKLVVWVVENVEGLTFTPYAKLAEKDGDKLVKPDVEVTASGTARNNAKYVVTFDEDNGTTPTTVTYYNGEMPTYETTPTKTAEAGYTYSFTGWNEALAPVTQNVTYTAQYDLSAITYTINFKVDDKIVNAVEYTVENGSTKTAPAVPEKEGHTGVWSEYDFTKLENQTAQAIYTANKYTVTLPTGNGFTATKVAGQTDEVEWGKDYKFTVTETGDTDKVVVKQGGNVLTADENGVYTVSVKANVSDITVSAYTMAQVMTQSEGDFWNYINFGAWGTNIWGETNTTAQFVGGNFTITKKFVEDAIAHGYTHAKFNLLATSENAIGNMVVDNNGGVVKYYSCNGTDAIDIRLDLTEINKTATKVTVVTPYVNLGGGGATGNTTFTVSGIEFFKSQETVEWTKSSKALYCAYEHGDLVIDTFGAGGNANVKTSAEWYSRYKFSDAGQRGMQIKQTWLTEQGSNRVVWGVNDWVDALNESGMIGNVNERERGAAIMYTDTDTFYLSMDREGVVKLSFADFYFNRVPGWNADLAYEQVNDNTIKVSTVNDQKLFYADVADRIAEGYTQVKITLQSTLPDGVSAWVGDDVWVGGHMYGINGTQTVNLADLIDQKLILMFTGGTVTDFVITYEFIK